MSISARLQITPAANRRGWTRRSLSLVSSLQGSGEDVTIHDLSSTGLLVEARAELAVGNRLEIDLPEAGSTPAIVVWSSGRFYGCQFAKRISQAAISAALLRSPARPNDSSGSILPDSKEPVSIVEAEGVFDDDRAPLSVRLRAIFGSALVLWALIGWAVWALLG